MSCVTMMTDGKTVVASADSAAIGGSELRIRATRKIFRVGGYLVGYVGSWRMGQILQYCTEFPDPPGDGRAGNLEGFIVAELVRTIRESFKREGFGKAARIAVSSEITEEGQDIGGVFLIGVRGQIFEIRQDFQVVRPFVPYAAIGYGAPVALGALHALENVPDLSIENKSRLALQAAESYCSGVRAPFYVESVSR